MRRPWNRGKQLDKTAGRRSRRMRPVGGDFQRCDDELALIVEQRRSVSG
jgi:hypothetical protein